MKRSKSNDAALHSIAPLVLVAPRMRVLYTPTPKAACTTIKMMLATAEGTRNSDVVDRLAVMHVSRAQTIHHPQVNGLSTLADFSARDKRHMLTSPDWLRVTSVRDPISRAYSAWENRIFMRAHRRTTTLIELAHDVRTDGRVDLAASFAHFAKVLGEKADVFMTDHHFLPQTNLARPDVIDYDTLVRVDQPGEIDALARVLTARSGKPIVPERLNEGLGVRVERVCDIHTANRLMATYASDYEAFDFPRRDWAPSVEPLLLSDMEARMLGNYRRAFERAVSVAREAQRRTGARYGVRQMRRAITKVARLENSATRPKETF